MAAPSSVKVVVEQVASGQARLAAVYVEYCKQLAVTKVYVSNVAER